MISWGKKRVRALLAEVMPVVGLIPALRKHWKRLEAVGHDQFSMTAMTLRGSHGKLVMAMTLHAMAETNVLVNLMVKPCWILPPRHRVARYEFHA